MDLSAPETTAEWRYEMRRDCQEILPGFLLGPFIVSKSADRMRELGITHVVCIRDAKEAWTVYPRFPGQFEYLTLDVEDTEDQNLIRLFPQALHFINTAIANGGRVLVHCNGGISLSPTFAIMYVMQHFKLPWDDALQYVQNRRYCISPNGGFLTQLKEWESIYRASQAVSGAPVQERSRRKREEEDDELGTDRAPMETKKRTIRPDDDDEDVEME
ncbi:phosphatases II [Clavulina sp. PMI_390]|nr:phosphatases II [Clavulina sp. PMI_390]